MSRLALLDLGLFAIALVLSILFNMLLFGDTLGEVLASPYMWVELVILAGTLVYLHRRQS